MTAIQMMRSRRIRILLISTTIWCVLAVAYAGWARYRVSDAAIHSDGWPREFPYPDEWIVAYAVWYAETYPPPPNTGYPFPIKPPIRLYLNIAIIVHAFVFVGGMTLLLFRWHCDKDELRCLACGYDLKGSKSLECPECGTSIGPIVALKRKGCRALYSAQSEST